MQPENDKEQWQQPQESLSQAPHYTPGEEGDVPTESQPETTPEEASNDMPVGDDDDEAVIHWQATEYIQHERSGVWFVVFAVVVVVLMATAWLLMRSLTFVILVPVMAATLLLYVRRPPGLIDYTVSRKGVHINDKLFAYSQFKSFGIISQNGNHSIMLVPSKRFQIGQTIYFPEDVGEPLVDMLAERLPMKDDIKPDAVDRLLMRLRI